MSFKDGDRVIVDGGWFLQEYKKPVAGIWRGNGKIDLDEPTKCKWAYKILYVLNEDCVPEIFYNSPLYKVLK